MSEWVLSTVGLQRDTTHSRLGNYGNLIHSTADAHYASVSANTPVGLASDCFSGSITPAAMSGVQTADEYLQSVSLSFGMENNTIATYRSREDEDDPPIGQLDPIGDAVVPLMVCATLYGIVLLKKRYSSNLLSKIRSVMQSSKRYVRRVLILCVLCMCFTGRAEAVFSAVGDTVSVIYPRIQETTVRKQISWNSYNGKTEGTEGTYSEEYDWWNGYTYWYTTVSYDTEYVVLGVSSTATGGTTVEGKTMPSSKNDLWVIHEAKDAGATALRYQNAGTGKWLNLNMNATGGFTLSLVDSEANAQAFDHEEAADSWNYKREGRAKYYPTINNDGEKLYIYIKGVETKQDKSTRWEDNRQYTTYTTTTQSYTYATDRVRSSAMECNKWTNREVRGLVVKAVPTQLNFPYAKDDSEAQQQIADVRYEFTLSDSTYLYNVPGVRNGYGAQKMEMKVSVITDMDVLLNQYGLQTSFYWWSNGGQKGNVSTLKAKNIDNSLSTSAQYAESERAMLQIADNAVRANDGHGMTMRVTPKGRSPFNIKDDKGNKTDYTDILVCYAKLADQTINSVAETNVVRSAYHYVDVDALTLRISPANYVFDGNAGSQDFDVIITHRQGHEIHTAEETNQESQVNETEKKIAEMDQASFLLQKTDLSGTSTWGEITNIDKQNNKLTIRVEQNNSSTNLEALLSSYIKLGNAEATRQNTIRQRGYNSQGDVEFVPYRGVSNTDLVDKRQAVHQLEKTIYYTADEIVALWLSETNFQGYMRWYDYNSGKDPRYDADGNDYEYFWYQKPYIWKGNAKTVFKSINIDGKTSHGVYMTYADGLKDAGYKEKAAQFAPLIRGWKTPQSRDIACDVSAYTDYIDDQDGTKTGKKQVQEPTLSYRQIFHLRPATEIADSLQKCIGDKYYEEHTYYAPTDASVFLETRFVHENALKHESEKCYFYYDKSGRLAQLGKDAHGQWYKNGNKLNINNNGTWDRYATYGGQTLDYLKVTSTTEQDVTYELRIPANANQTGREICVAKFTIHYLDPQKYGPTPNTLITDKEINENYIMLSKQDFNFGQKPGTDNITYYDGHLAWEESSYGYMYPNWSAKGMGRQSNTKDFAYYGEYSIVNRVNKDWAKGEQHGGAANGYCLYVDGTMQPGLVASISTNVRICSGQQLYCYAWVNNSAPTEYTASASPIFRFNVQGRNKGDAEWTDVGTFFAGEIGRGKGWQQVCFPVLSAHDYDESRVSIYNFATTNSGNDFLIDDICLYASKLPLSAYQAITTCAEDSLEATIARIDYSRLTGEWDCKNIYYHFYNRTDGTAVKTTYYYPEGTKTTDKNEAYGFIRIPESDYDPLKSSSETYRTNRCLQSDESKMVYLSASAFIDSLVNLLNRDHLKEITRKGYVKTNEDNHERYVLYIGHILSKEVLSAEKSYELRMAATVKELDDPECALRTELPVNNRTSYTFNGHTYPTTGECANGLYPVEVVVKNQMKIGDDVKPLEAIAKADWLIGEAFDDVFYDKTPDAQTKAEADKAFEQKYGYDRGVVRDAIVDMRRPDTKNYTATSAEQLVRSEFSDKTHYDLIVDLCNRGYLALYKGQEKFYMEGGDTIRYWIYPIQGTAKAEYNGVEYTLSDCDEPSYIRVTTLSSEYAVNLSPVKREDMTDLENGQVPRVRVSASEVNRSFQIPVSDITDNVIFGWDSCHLYSTTDPEMQALLDQRLSAEKFSVRYSQDKVFQDVQQSGHDGYYTSGSYITFTAIDQAHVDALKQRHDIVNAQIGLDESKKTYPHDAQWGYGQPGFQAANTHQMRAGYEYTMETTLFTKNYESVSGDCPIGKVYFTIVVVPDTMIWSPTVSNEWGDDRNWHAVINGQEQSFGYVPMPQTMVILPTLSNKGQYPYLRDTVRYPMDAHFTPNSCKKIRFRHTATLLNQHLLHYEEAFVDMHIKEQGSWYSVSAPLQDMYSGDFFVPHTGAFDAATAGSKESSEDFTVNGFEGARYTDAAYVFWASYYNKEVATLHQGGSTSMNTYTTNTLSFSKSNSLTERILPGQGFQVKGYGPDNAGDQEIEIRFPKSDMQYQWYDSLGNATGQFVAIPSRTNGHKFAFDADQNGTMEVELTNDTESEYYLFGNPAMAYLNMESFCEDNSDVVEMQYQYMDGSSWVTRTPSTATQYSDRFIAPMQSVLLRAKGGKGKSLKVKVKSTQLATYLLEGENIGSDEPNDDLDIRYAPRRAQGHYLRNSVMQITAYTPRRAQDGSTPYARAFATVAMLEFANNGYEQGEDVQFLSSGVEAGNVASSVATSPLNVYTIAGDEALMADVRSEIGVVPIGVLANKNVRKKFTKLSLVFNLSETWDEECYLYDSQTGDKQRIMNGTTITIDMPKDHELRYYLQGSHKDEPSVPSDNQTPASDKQQSGAISAFSNAHNRVCVVADGSIETVRIYDVVGRLTGEYRPAVETALYTAEAAEGLAIVEVVLQDGTKAQRKVMVK